MVELVSSMIVDLKIRVAEFNAKVNSSMVEVKRMGMQVKDLGKQFTVLGALGLGVFASILAISPEMAMALVRLKLLWRDFRLEMGKRLAPHLNWVANELQGLWNWMKVHPLALDIAAGAIGFLSVLTALGLVIKGASWILGPLAGTVVGGALVLTMLVAVDILLWSEAVDHAEKLWTALDDLRTLLGDDVWTNNIAVDIPLFIFDSWNNFKDLLTGVSEALIAIAEWDYSGLTEAITKIKDSILEQLATMQSFVDAHPVATAILFPFSVPYVIASEIAKRIPESSEGGMGETVSGEGSLYSPTIIVNAQPDLAEELKGFIDDWWTKNNISR